MELKRFEDIKQGDLVVAPGGTIEEVTKVYDIHTPKHSFRVTNEDSESIVVSGSHLWYVVTETDLGLHRRRLKDHRKVLRRGIIPEVLTYLEERAKSGLDKEVSMSSFFDLLGDSAPMKEVIRRVTLSIGRVAESRIIFEEGQEQETETIYHYNERIFAQQILGLYNPKKYPYHVRMGRVINTYQLSLIYDEVTLPDVTLPEL